MTLSDCRVSARAPLELHRKGLFYSGDFLNEDDVACAIFGHRTTAPRAISHEVSVSLVLKRSDVCCLNKSLHGYECWRGGERRKSRKTLVNKCMAASSQASIIPATIW